MTAEEFRKRLEEEKDWAPGWQAIDQEFERIYPGQEPKHYGTNMAYRAMFGGNEYLDGCSLYLSDNGYRHLVTYGMTELYADEKMLGAQWNKWGYEMTMKLPEQDSEKCLWAVDMLSNLARYTYTEKRYFEPFQYVAGNGTSICKDRKSDITALMTVYDTEVNAIDTIYGRTEFIQLVGITEYELEMLKKDVDNPAKLYERIKQDNPYLVTDLSRTKSYL